MNFRANEIVRSRPNGSQLMADVLIAVGREVDRQLVFDIGGEILDGSGFEREVPDSEFDERS